MKVKNRNLAELILQIAALALLVLPGMFERGVWLFDNSIVYHGRATLKYSTNVSFYDLIWSGDSLQTLLGLLLFAAMIAGVVLYIIQYTGKSGNRNSQLAAFLPIGEGVVLAAFAALSFTPAVAGDFQYTNTASTLFYLEAVLLLVLIVLALVTYSKAKKLGVIDEAPQAAPAPQGVNVPEELMKYKQLLDTGAITPEEYEEKKRQLLNR